MKTVSAVAEQLGVSRNYVYDRLAEFGAIVVDNGKRGRDGRAAKRTIRIPDAAVESWIRRHTLPVRIDGQLVRPLRTHRPRSEDVSRIIREARRTA